MRTREIGFNRTAVRSLYESLGPYRFVLQMYHLMGLADQTGNFYLTESNTAYEVRNPKNAAGQEIPRLKPQEFSLRALAEGIIGEDWSQKLTPGAVNNLALLEAAGNQSLLEAGTNMVTASVFADINAFTAVVSGLLEIEVLTSFRAPEFIQDELMPIHNTRMFAGRKVIGTTRLGDVAEPRIQGMPTKRVGFGERWILQPTTVENAVSCEVTQEAVYLDLTGEVLEQAQSVGYWTGYRKEIRVIDAFIGVTNTYQYKGTSYNTYLTSGYFTNDISSNELLHWSNLETIFLTFRNMQDPETSTYIQTNPNRWLVNQGKLFTAESIVGAREVEYRDAPGSTTNPQQIRKFATPERVNKLGEPLCSALVYQECIAAGGLALSASTADKYWWVWDSNQPPFKYAQNWPLRVQQAPPNQLDMIDRGVVLFVKADERGVPMVYEPRRVVRSHP